MSLERPTAVWNDTVYHPQVIIFALFGQNNQLTETEIHQLIAPLVEEWGRTPDRILLPSEGKSSAYFLEWAESMELRTAVFHCDWMRNGRTAQILRDDRMMKECTHALCFLSSRSKRMESFAEKWTRKGKTVFTWSTAEGLVQLEMDHEPKKGSVPDRKSNTGTMLEWLQCHPKE
jgi:hypothetical protein